MPYEEVFTEFWEHVVASAEEGDFAKLTMAKTIGKPELKNIFLRPVYTKSGFMVLLKMHYKSKEVADTEEKITLEEAFTFVQKHLKTSFFTVLLFTRTKDLVFKVNKKGVGSITEAPPTFTNIVQAEIDE